MVWMAFRSRRKRQGAWGWSFRLIDPPLHTYDPLLENGIASDEGFEQTLVFSEIEWADSFRPSWC